MYMIQKDSAKATTTGNHRPTIPLPTMFKLLTSIKVENTQAYLEENNIQ